MNGTPPSTSRRQFLVAGGRVLGLGGLGAYVAAEELKRRRLTNDPDCVKVSVCQDCLELSRCDKPKAEKFRVSAGGVGAAKARA